MNALRRAVFLDRDGTLNRQLTRDGLPYPPASVAEFELFPEVKEACERRPAAGYVLVVATNRLDVGRGTLRREVVDALHDKLRSFIPSFAQIRACFHAGADQGEPCECRKPKPKMLLVAADDLGIDLTRSEMI